MDKRKIKIGFLGYGTRALDALMEHPLYEVKYFWAPEKRLCKDVYDAQERYKDLLKMEVVKNNDNLVDKLKDVEDVECFLMNACPIILNEKVLKEMTFYNIHPGNLENNRGHQPHLWTVLLGEKESEITLHTVCTGIDEGDIIASPKVEITERDNALDVLDRLEDQIPLLLDRLYEHLVNGQPPQKTIMGGGYRRIMIPDDYKIDFAEAKSHADFELQMDRKIRARSMNHGAFFVYEGNRIYVDKLLAKDVGEYSDALVVHERDSKQIIVEVNKCKYTFHINKIQPETKGE